MRAGRQCKLHKDANTITDLQICFTRNIEKIFTMYLLISRENGSMALRDQVITITLTLGCHLPLAKALVSRPHFKNHCCKIKVQLSHSLKTHCEQSHHCHGLTVSLIFKEDVLWRQSPVMELGGCKVTRRGKR